MILLALQNGGKCFPLVMEKGKVPLISTGLRLVLSTRQENYTLIAGRKDRK